MPDERQTYATPPWLVAAMSFGAAALALLAAGQDDRSGRFLLAVLATVTVQEALRLALLRPTLAVDDDGIEVVVGWRRERLPWSSVEAVRVMGPPSSGGRLRRRANALEIDLGDRLVLVQRYRLGVPVAQVAAGITRSGRVGGTIGGD